MKKNKVLINIVILLSLLVLLFSVTINYKTYCYDRYIVFDREYNIYQLVNVHPELFRLRVENHFDHINEIDYTFCRVSTYSLKR